MLGRYNPYQESTGHSAHGTCCQCAAHHSATESRRRGHPQRGHTAHDHTMSHIAGGTLSLLGILWVLKVNERPGRSWEFRGNQWPTNQVEIISGKKKGRIKEELFHFFTQTVSLPTNFQKLELAPGQIALPHRQLLHLRWGTDSAALSELLSFQTSLVGRFHNPFEKI